MATERATENDQQQSGAWLAAATTQPMIPVPDFDRYQEPAGAQDTGSYYLTRWAIVNRLLAKTEQVTHGRAGVIQRLFTYLIVGGFAALVNLAVFGVMLSIPLVANEQLHNVLAYVIAAETSIMANFIPNDRITFSHLPGHSRSWWARCMRFHITSISGTILTFVIEYALHFGLHIPALIGEAIAIIIVLFYNFTAHHFFTYRHVA